MGCLVQVLELILPLEGFDKSLLGKVLGVIYIPDQAIDEQENAT